MTEFHIIAKNKKSGKETLMTRSHEPLDSRKKAETMLSKMDHNCLYNDYYIRELAI